MENFDLRSFIRFLGKNKFYTAINVTGFAVSLAVVILISLYVRQELSVDDFHKNKERIFLLCNEEKGSWAYPLTEDLRNKFPEIEAATFVQPYFYGSSTKFRRDDLSEILRSSIYLVDTSFFDVFSFHMAEGNPATALRRKGSLVLTRSFARKLFGEESALGQTIVQENGKRWNVSGVVEDFGNSHLPSPDILVTPENFRDEIPDLFFGYQGNSGLIYLLTSEGSNLSGRTEAIVEYLKTRTWLFSTGMYKKILLIPLKEVFFSPSYSLYYRSSSKGWIGILALTALMILLFAAINYTNLTIAQSALRAQEAAIRHLLGERKAVLFLRMILESVLLCLAALMLAVSLVPLLEPHFNKLFQTELGFSDHVTLPAAATAIGTVLLLGILAGIAPACAIVRFRAVEVVKGVFRRKTKTTHGKFLIFIQYFITATLIGCACIIIQQTHYLRHKEMGFNPQDLYCIHYPVPDEKATTLRSELSKIPGIETLSIVHMSLLNRGENNTFDFNGKMVSTQWFGIDSLTFRTMGIEILHHNGLQDGTPAVWLNETAMNELGLSFEDQYLSIFEQQLAIAGVIRDFHCLDVTKKITPAIFSHHHLPSKYATLIRLKTGKQYDPEATVTAIYETFKTVFSEEGPIYGISAEEQIQQWSDKQERQAGIIIGFSLLAILLSSLGMLAMASYYIRQREGEIAVRKVFGSTDREVLVRLTGSFLKIVVYAFIPAVPLIWLLMQRWLSNFPYRTGIGWIPFAAALCIPLTIAFLTVFLRCRNAARTNPAQTLKK